jgi:hypothetical protein
MGTPHSTPPPSTGRKQREKLKELLLFHSFIIFAIYFLGIPILFKLSKCIQLPLHSSKPFGRYVFSMERCVRARTHVLQAGVTHCFVNLGSDHPSIIEAIVKGQNEKDGQFPRIITCPNEVCLPLQSFPSTALISFVIDGRPLPCRWLRPSHRQTPMRTRPR